MHGLSILVFGLGWQELLIILAIVIIIFGGARLAGLGKASGRAIREFKDEVSDHSKPAPADATAPAQPTAIESIATPTPPVVQPTVAPTAEQIAQAQAVLAQAEAATSPDSPPAVPQS